MPRLSIDVTDELHRGLKVQAARSGCTVAELVRPALEGLAVVETIETSPEAGAQVLAEMLGAGYGKEPNLRSRGVGGAGGREAPGVAPESTPAPSSGLATPPTVLAGARPGDEPGGPATFDPPDQAAAHTVPASGGSCVHPKERQLRHSWGTMCGACGERVR